MLVNESAKTELGTHKFGTFLIHEVKKTDSSQQPNQDAYRQP